MLLQRSKNIGDFRRKAIEFLTCLAAALLFLVPFGTPADAQVRKCRLEVNSQYDSDSQAMQKFLRCLNNRISDLQKTNAQLQRRIARLEAVAGELPTPWSNEDGVITEEPGRPIGSATLVLSARSTGGESALAIDQRVLEEVCGRSGGCTLTLVLNQLSLFDKKPKSSAVSGPCQFSYNSDTGAWAISAGCPDAAQSGIDGDGGLGGRADNAAEIAVAGGACILADSGLAKAVGADALLASDRSKGLYLIAMPSRQTGASRRFQCEMSLE